MISGTTLYKNIACQSKFVVPVDLCVSQTVFFFGSFGMFCGGRGASVSYVCLLNFCALFPCSTGSY